MIECGECFVKFDPGFRDAGFRPMYGVISINREYYPDVTIICPTCCEVVRKALDDRPLERRDPG